MPTLSVRALFEFHRETLELDWLAGDRGAKHGIASPQTASGEVSLVGHLNIIRPNRIQVLGQAELAYLARLGKNSRQDALDILFGGTAAMVVLADGVLPDAELHARADTAAVALVGSPLPSNALIGRLQFHLDEALADKRIEHGVFLDVMGIGILLTGASGIGKSELALELITRGHRLVADDAPEFWRSTPATLHGRCPEPLEGFLEVRGLGIVNIRAMFGDTAIREHKRLQLILRLEPLGAEALNELDRLGGSRRARRLLDVDIPERLLPVAPGRNLAVIVEAAVRNHVLALNGYDAVEDFTARQKRYLEHGP